VSFFLLLEWWGRVDEEIRGGRWVRSQPTVSIVRADGRPIPSITVYLTNSKHKLK
jgi:hypothetical protein